MFIKCTDRVLLYGAVIFVGGNIVSAARTVGTYAAWVRAASRMVATTTRSERVTITPRKKER